MHCLYPAWNAPPGSRLSFVMPLGLDPDSAASVTSLLSCHLCAVKEAPPTGLENVGCRSLSSQATSDFIYFFFY